MLLRAGKPASYLRQLGRLSSTSPDRTAESRTTGPSETSRRQVGRVTGARGTKHRRSPSRQRSVKRLPKRRRTGRSSVAQRGKMMLSSLENVSDSDGESIDASLLDAIEHPRIERWPLDSDLTRVICAFVPRRYAQCACISQCFRDQREALRRGEARAAIAAAVPVQLAAAIEAVLWTTETRESYGRATRRIVFALRRNDQLRQRVLDGSLTPSALAALDEEALAPPAVAQRRADDRSRLAKRVGARPSTLPEVDAFECPRCGARRAYVANATHGGSVDRAHILARCLECGRGWAP